MPNHITNIIKASPEVLKSIVNESGRVDFNLVIPSFDDGQGGMINMQVEELAESCLPFGSYEPENFMDRIKLRSMMDSDVSELSDENFDKFIIMLKNYREHGYIHSMDFARKAWGTKWNAYECEIKDDEVSFETAWSHPAPVIKALSTAFPDEEISVLYADEDTGSNCGKYTIKNGVITSEDIAPKWSEQSEEEKSKWSEFAIKLRYGSDAKPEDFDMDENWRYVE